MSFPTNLLTPQKIVLAALGVGTVLRLDLTKPESIVPVCVVLGLLATKYSQGKLDKMARQIFVGANCDPMDRDLQMVRLALAVTASTWGMLSTAFSLNEISKGSKSPVIGDTLLFGALTTAVGFALFKDYLHHRRQAVG